MRWLIAIGELALLCWFVAVGVDAAFQRAFVDRDSPFRLGEFHHGYLGAGVVIVGFVMGSVAGCFVQLLGVVFTIDDTWQHMRQTLDGKHGYKSPLHQIFARYLWPLPLVRWLTRALDRWWVVGIVLGLLALWIFGCASTELVPTVPRPDTRRVAGVLLTAEAGAAALAMLQQAVPNEGSVCFYGGARDTLIEQETFVLLLAQRAERAHADSANQFHVWYRDRSAGCALGGLVGIGHSHPYIPPTLPCTHSVPDSYLLFGDPAALFSIVFCGDGRLEVMYQDGRRIPDRWRQ